MFKTWIPTIIGQYKRSYKIFVLLLCSKGKQVIAFSSRNIEAVICNQFFFIDLVFVCSDARYSNRRKKVAQKSISQFKAF